MQLPDTGGLSPLGYKIFLDRYAVKDPDKRRFSMNNLAIVQPDPDSDQRELGMIVDADQNAAGDILRYGVRLYETDEIIVVPADRVSVPLETRPEQVFNRVAVALADVETNEVRKFEWLEKFKWLLDDFKFVPGGRILAAAGSGQDLTFYNCYVLPSSEDSREGIFQRLATMAEIMSRGGGVGMNLSSLRPRNAYVKGVNGRSSGAVSWGSLFSTVTGLIEQGGSRRGALMLILDDWHPDIFDFITAKREAGKIENANISVAVSDAFMEAVEVDGDWELIFPDTSHPDYAYWKGDPDTYVGPMVVHRTVKARELWDAICESAWASAEPGVWFKDRANELSNSRYYAPLISTNPCGEQSLPAWGVCNLGAINLPKFVGYDALGKPYVVWSELLQAVEYAVRFLDNAIDATPYFFEENERRQKSERRVGLGTMGLAEMLIKLQIRYGSPASLQFIDELFSAIHERAYNTSAHIAQEKGVFPEYRSDEFRRTESWRDLGARTRDMIVSHGLRNVTLLTQAPTGTTGTMVGTSTGIEPYFAWEYTRKSRLGVHTEYVGVFREWVDRRDLNEALPDYFVTAQELTPEEHVAVQAAVQKHIDSGISKTANLPANYSVADTKRLYELMYASGCKGGTVFRDGSRDDQVLRVESTNDERADSSPADAAGGAAQLALPDPRHDAARPATPAGDLVAIRHRFHVGELNGYIICSFDDDGRLIEVFLPAAKAGSATQGLLSALAVTISTALQAGVDKYDLTRRLRGMQFEPAGLTGNPAIPTAGSVVDYIARYLEDVEVPDLARDVETMAPRPDASAGAYRIYGNLCPSCGSTARHQDGCLICDNCGGSRCG